MPRLFSFEAMLSPHGDCDHHTLAVIARLDRAIQYAEAVVIERRVAAYWMPAFAGMTAVVWRGFLQQRELITRPVMIRARKGSFTIRVDQMFTASRGPAFTTHAITP